MAKFDDSLDVEKINLNNNDGRGTWRLCKPLVYESDVLKDVIQVPAGFQTDFASVPRIPIIFDILGDRGDLAGVVHDCLYDKQCTINTDRKTADKVLKEALIAQGVTAWMAWVMYLGVRIGAASHFRK
jgi:hypothetical protein